VGWNQPPFHPMHHRPTVHVAGYLIKLFLPVLLLVNIYVDNHITHVAREFSNILKLTDKSWPLGRYTVKIHTSFNLNNTASNLRHIHTSRVSTGG
jgi:hypothetical protein